MTPFDWGRYLSLAYTLAADPDEASQRSAISRAYYACFGRASSYARNHGYTQSGSSHDRVWEWFKQSRLPSGGDINELGKRIKNRRTVADYRATDPIIMQQGNMVVDWASELLELLLALPKTSEPQLAADAPSSGT